MPTQAEIPQALGVAKISLKRAVKRDRPEGSKTLYGPRKGRGPAVAKRAGRLHKPAKNPWRHADDQEKSARSAADRVAPMGMAAADVEDRLAASVGEFAAVAPGFAPALDVPNGGLLCALLAVGLLDEHRAPLELAQGLLRPRQLADPARLHGPGAVEVDRVAALPRPGGAGQPPGV